MVTQLLPLQVKSAVSSKRGRVLVGPIDLNVTETGTTIVMGPNGSGKTSLLHMLHGTARLSQGRIDWACDMPTARKHQAFVFQRPIMLRRSVLGNLIYPLTLQGVPKNTARRRAEHWAEKISLTRGLGQSAHSLSGGEQQKLALARAMITEPKVLFLDEPTAALDGAATRAIEQLLAEAQQAGTKIIMTTHDAGQARRLAQDLIILLNGQILEQGATEAVMRAPKSPKTRAFFRGDIVE